MAFRDVRQFIKALADHGKLVYVKEEVDWDLEARAIACHSREMGGPIPLFEKVKGYPPGYRIFGPASLGLTEMAIALGLSPDISWIEFGEEVTRRLEHPIKPVVVKSGPCKENILKGDEANLYRFPAPYFTPGDGGRMIGTLDIVIAKDPDSDWLNWGTYRLMIHDKKHTGVSMPANQARELWLEHFRPFQKPMPLAVAIGADPYCQMASAIHFPVGVSEVDYAGALKQEPVELVKCETSELLVPANAEIILEGELLPDAEMYEGPFVEWTAHETSYVLMPVFRVNTITHRNDPILTAETTTVSAVETTSVAAINLQSFRKVLKEHGIPFTDIFCPLEMKGACLVIGLKRTGKPNIVNQIANVVLTHDAFVGATHIFIVVDEDVDVYNTTEVLHALAMRCNPAKGIIIRPWELGMPLMPFLNHEEREELRGASVIFDCTWPTSWPKEDFPPRVTFKSTYPKELQQRILGKWQKYGFK